MSLALLVALAAGCGRRAPDAGAPGAGGAVAAALGGAGGGSAGPCEHPGVVQDCDDEFCRVPAGCFVMGAPREAVYATALSDTQVEVYLSHNLLVGRTEVTYARWRELGLPDPEIDWRKAGSPAASQPAEGYLPTCTEPECPVVWAGFEDALTYANLRSMAEGLPSCYELDDCAGAVGRNLRCHVIRVAAESVYACRGYRLPTEAEWEYAARAGTNTAFHSGEMLPDLTASESCRLDPNLDAIGWYCHNSGPAQHPYSGVAHPVAHKVANGWGLHDVSGNAREWANDFYDPRGYGEGHLIDPVFGMVDPLDLHPAEHPVYGINLDAGGYAVSRMTRGGDFALEARLCVSSRRLAFSRDGVQWTGFRIVRTDPRGSRGENR